MSGDSYITFLLMIPDDRRNLFCINPVRKPKEVTSGDIWDNSLGNLFCFLVKAKYFLYA